MSRRLLLAAAGVLALALGGGCATDNPREGGFLGGLGLRRLSVRPGHLVAAS